jgi:hypothetical protein
MLPHRFSLRDCSPRIITTLLKSIGDSLLIESRGRRSFDVLTSHIQQSPDGKSAIVRSSAYGSRLRTRSPVEFVFSDGSGGAKKVTGQAKSVFGRNATVEIPASMQSSLISAWFAHAARKPGAYCLTRSNNFNEVDQAMVCTLV